MAMVTNKVQLQIMDPYFRCWGRKIMDSNKSQITTVDSSEEQVIQIPTPPPLTPITREDSLAESTKTITPPQQQQTKVDFSVG